MISKFLKFWALQKVEYIICFLQWVHPLFLLSNPFVNTTLSYANVIYANFFLLLSRYIRCFAHKIVFHCRNWDYLLWKQRVVCLYRVRFFSSVCFFSFFVKKNFFRRQLIWAWYNLDRPLPNYIFDDDCCVSVCHFCCCSVCFSIFLYVSANVVANNQTNTRQRHTQKFTKQCKQRQRI